MDTIYSAFSKIKPFLTDFAGGEEVFKQAFDVNAQLKVPIKTILELGIYRIQGQPENDLPGQSTKTLMILSNFHPVEKYVSLDIDDCSSTIARTKWFLKERCQMEPKNHSFVRSSSVEYDVSANFPNGVDFCFIDTSHDDSYVANHLGIPGHDGAGMTYKELCYYANHITKNGRLFMHDTHNFYLPKQYGYNTEGAIQKFLDDYSDFVFVEHNPNGNGLGELIHRDSDVAKYYSENGIQFIRP